MNHQFERPAVAEPNRREVTHIARRETPDAKRLGERHYRGVDEAKAEFREATVNSHRPGQLTDCWRRVSEGAAREILHERLHRRPLVTKEVVDLGEYQSRNVASPGLVNGVAEEPVVWCALDEVIDQRTRIADQRGATGRH